MPEPLEPIDAPVKYANTAHWAMLIACIALALNAIGMDISELMGWEAVKTPTFIGSLISHVGSILGAYVSGRLFTIDKLPRGH